jgi:serine protease Do
VAPKAEHEEGWMASEADAVRGILKELLDEFTIDRQRIVAHGMGVGGQVAMYLGFNNRDLVHGVCAVGAVVTNMKDNTASQRLSFFLAGGELDPLIKSIAESRTKLVDRRYPVLYRELAKQGREYLPEAAIREVAQWIDTLDRQ